MGGVRGVCLRASHRGRKARRRITYYLFYCVMFICVGVLGWGEVGGVCVFNFSIFNIYICVRGCVGVGVGRYVCVCGPSTKRR